MTLDEALAPMDRAAFIQGLPKAELHLHIEGSLEPAMMLELAGRNGVELPYADIAEVRAAYEFSNLQDFLDLYYAGMGVLRTASDFFALADACFRRVEADNVTYLECFQATEGLGASAFGSRESDAAVNSAGTGS